jgi:hypothetical protein
LSDDQKEATQPNIVERNMSGPWTDLGLTLPIFVSYHLGVVFLPMRNAADWVTHELVALADNNLSAYGLLTLAIAAVYVGVLTMAGRGKALHWQNFGLLAVESVLYAVAMRAIAGFVVGELLLGPPATTRTLDAISLGVPGEVGPLSGLVLSCGAGFYEEVAFRVLLFGLGLKAIQLLFALRGWHKPLVFVGWALFTSMVFSLWHYVGPLGDPLDAKSFLFRWVCGLVFTLIYAFRGFAPAVWTHALYDIWVLVF